MFFVRHVQFADDVVQQAHAMMKPGLLLANVTTDVALAAAEKRSEPLPLIMRQRIVERILATLTSLHFSSFDSATVTTDSPCSIRVGLSRCGACVERFSIATTSPRSVLAWY